MKRTNEKNAIAEKLLMLGMPANVLGFRYICHAIYLARNDESYLSLMTKRLYREVAETYGTSPESVERAMRHAISLCYERGDLELLRRYCPFVPDFKSKRPTCSEFISAFVYLD